MKNELVEEFKKQCSQFDNVLRGYYDEVVERGADQEDIDDLVDLMYDLNSLRGTTKDNLKTSKILFEDIQNRFYYKKAFVDSYLDERELEDEEDYDDVQEVTVVDASESTKSKAFKVLTAVVGGVLLTGTAIHTGIVAKNKGGCAGTSKESTIETTEAEKFVVVDEVKEDTKETTTKDATNTNTNLVLGEYGTFTDITNEEQVQARAKYIYDNYFAPIYDKLDEGQKQLITVENIANMIRVMNAELPVDSEGYQFFDGVTVDDYTQVLVEAYVNAPSNEGLEYQHFPAYLLTVDGSEVSEFIKSYDVIYDKLAYSMTVHDDEQARDAIACLGYKFWNEWYLQGMYGDVNPHLFDTDLKYLTFISTVEPYNTTALEWHLSQQEPVCIEACIDYNTGEKSLLSVNDIKVALETGAWNNVSARLAGIDAEPNPWLGLYWEALNDQLTWKYDHRNVKTLK